MTISGYVGPAPGNCVDATGTIDFYDSGTYIGTGTLAPIAGGTSSASITSSTLAMGSHSLTADYSGDSSYNAANSSAASLTINQASTNTAVASSVNPSTYNQSVTFTATVTAASPGSGTPTGTVTFKCNGTTMGTGSISGGVATFTRPLCRVGTNGNQCRIRRRHQFPY